MKTLIQATLAIMTLAFCMTAEAQQQGFAAVPQTQVQVNPYQPPAPNPYYFGMDVQIVNEYGSAKLFIANVTPGGPAQLAGLEYGDEIVSVNNQRIAPANDSVQAVRNLNRMVRFIGGPSPASPAAASASGVAYAAAIPNRPPAPPTANMVVRNVRNGQFVNITVYPAQVGNPGIGAPAQASPAQASPAAAGASYPR